MAYTNYPMTKQLRPACDFRWFVMHQNKDHDFSLPVKTYNIPFCPIMTFNDLKWPLFISHYLPWHAISSNPVWFCQDLLSWSATSFKYLWRPHMVACFPFIICHTFLRIVMTSHYLSLLFMTPHILFWHVMTPHYLSWPTNSVRKEGRKGGREGR